MARTRARWMPIVDGQAAAGIRRVVLDIADVLRDSRKHAAFPNGAAARALFFGYLADAWPDDAWSGLAGACLDAAISQISDEEMAPLLFNGFAGTAWVVEHLQGHLLDSDDADPNEAIDEALLELTARSRPHDTNELMYGLAGLGVYAWERRHRPSARVLIEQVVARLDELAVARDGGRTWLTLPEALHPEVLPDHPEGRITLGTAHGVPGTLVLLALACESGIAVERARPLLEDVVRCLLAQRSAGALSIVPRWIDLATGVALPSRAAWCYGDPGAGAALLWAARAVGVNAWEQAALEIMARGAAHSLDSSGVVDAGICHGAAGLTHLFNRAFQATGNTCLRQSALTWLDHTLAYRRLGGACAGFLAQGESGLVEDESLLSGIAGIGMTLLAAIAAVEPEWDRVFACAVPPR